MNYKFKRALRKIKHINIWGILSLLFLLVTLSVFAYYGFMLMEAQRLENLIQKREELILTKQQELRTLKKDVGFKKYKSAKLLIANSDKTKWKENLEYLIELLDELSNLDSSDTSVMLENFQITSEQISLRGTISSIGTMYREGGIIDKFTEFDFVESLDIPFYRRNGEFFQFVLDAKIRSDVGQN